MAVDAVELEATAQRETLRLEGQVLDILGASPEFIHGWTINRIRDDGAIDAHVPLDQMDVTNVPTDPANVSRLRELFEEHQKEVGGTGQRDPVVIGHVHGEGLYLVDGFHRHVVQFLRGKPTLHSTIEPNLTYEQIVKRRLEYAHTHPEVEFARQVEWMQSVWDRTPWAKRIPNVLTAFRAFQDDYALQGTDDVVLIDRLSDSVYEEIRDWVRRQSKEWGYSPKQIRDKLSKVESFDPSMMHLVYQRPGQVPAGRLGLVHVQAITEVFGGEFDLQKPIVEAIVKQQLNRWETVAFLHELEAGSPRSAKDIKKLVDNVNFIEIKAQNRTKSVGSKVGNLSLRGLELDDSVDPSEVLMRVTAMLPSLKRSALEAKEWTERDVANALQISVTLSEIVAVLVKQKSIVKKRR